MIVIAWNDVERTRAVCKYNIDALTVSQALSQAIKDAVRWNEDEQRPHAKVRVVECEGKTLTVVKVADLPLFGEQP